MRKSTESALVVTVAMVLLLICRWKAAVEYSTASVVITCRMTSRGRSVQGVPWPLHEASGFAELGKEAAEAGLWCGALCIPSLNTPYHILAGIYVTYSLKFCPPGYAVEAKLTLHHEGYLYSARSVHARSTVHPGDALFPPQFAKIQTRKIVSFGSFKIPWSVVRLCFHF
jgi:hypothetical protein